jgi:hypothetical protein
MCCLLVNSGFSSRQFISDVKLAAASKKAMQITLILLRFAGKK